MKATSVLGILLAVSVAANLFLGSAYMGQRDKATVAKVEKAAVVGESQKTEAIAQKCSDGVKELDQQAQQRAKDGDAAREKVRERVVVKYVKADKVLAAPAPAPGAVCEGAESLTHEWLKGRKK